MEKQENKRNKIDIGKIKKFSRTDDKKTGASLTKNTKGGQPKESR